MECIKYSEDMHKMREAFAENKRFECLDRKTANVIRYCSNINIDYDNNEEVVNMCKAFEENTNDKYATYTTRYMYYAKCKIKFININII